MEIDIKRMNGDYSVQFKQGVQTFSLDGVEDKETAHFMKAMLESAFKSFIDEEIKSYIKKSKIATNKDL